MTPEQFVFWLRGYLASPSPDVHLIGATARAVAVPAPPQPATLTDTMKAVETNRRALLDEYERCRGAMKNSALPPGYPPLFAAPSWGVSPCL